HPVSSSVSRAAASSADSPSSRRPAGTSQPHLSVMKRWRQISRKPRSGSCTTTPAAGAPARTTWWSNRRPSGSSTSAIDSDTQSLSYIGLSPWTVQRTGLCLRRCELRVVQVAVQAPVSQQLLVRPPLDDAATFDHEDLVGRLD